MKEPYISPEVFALCAPVLEKLFIDAGGSNYTDESTKPWFGRVTLRYTPIILLMQVEGLIQARAVGPDRDDVRMSRKTVFHDKSNMKRFTWEGHSWYTEGYRWTVTPKCRKLFEILIL